MCLDSTLFRTGLTQEWLSNTRGALKGLCFLLLSWWANRQRVSSAKGNDLVIDLSVRFEITAVDSLKLQGHLSPSSFQGRKIKCHAVTTSGPGL